MEGKVQLLADPTGAFGEGKNLLRDDSSLPLFGIAWLKGLSMVMDEGVVKALNAEPEGTGFPCSLASPTIS